MDFWTEYCDFINCIENQHTSYEKYMRSKIKEESKHT